MECPDPYFSVQDEVLKNLQSAGRLYREWSSVDVADSDEAARISNDLRQLVKNTEWDLEDIQETVSIAEKNPARFQLSEKDIAARYQFLKDTRDVLKKVKVELNRTSRHIPNRMNINFAVTGAKPRRTDQSLPNGLSQRNSVDSDAHSTVPLTETRNAYPSVFPVPTSDPLSAQKELIRHQDNRLDQLGVSISTLKGMSRQIGNELDDQVVLLEDFSGEITHTESKLDAVTKRTARLLHLSTDRRQWCAIGCLTLTLLIILVLLFVL
ncbi:unnamed protein product [Calicophoron daubneyi]|uniref:t-SNARE coiled-coil homology domain-containing protein n=1 Tax=Calicophoron daubneyi TaxID=300641 RepID=A0AAV2TBR5_CALDB